MAKTFGAKSTTDEVLEGVDLSGKRVLVTGVSAGLGVETAVPRGRRIDAPPPCCEVRLDVPGPRSPGPGSGTRPRLASRAFSR